MLWSINRCERPLHSCQFAWIATIISAMNVIFKDILQATSSLLEHVRNTKSMWVECTRFFMRSRDSLLRRIKNYLNTLFQTVFSERIWPIYKVRGTSANCVEQIIWCIIRPYFNSRLNGIELRSTVISWEERVRVMVLWHWQHFCCTRYTLNSVVRWKADISKLFMYSKQSGFECLSNTIWTINNTIICNTIIIIITEKMVCMWNFSHFGHCAKV